MSIWMGFAKVMGGVGGGGWEKMSDKSDKLKECVVPWRVVGRWNGMCGRGMDWSLSRDHGTVAVAAHPPPTDTASQQLKREAEKKVDGTAARNG